MIPNEIGRKAPNQCWGSRRNQLMALIPAIRGAQGVEPVVPCCKPAEDSLDSPIALRKFTGGSNRGWDSRLGCRTWGWSAKLPAFTHLPRAGIVEASLDGQQPSR